MYMSKKDYFFSIVIPVYNAEKYIKDMIESIRMQTYTNWEMIIIDDGSKDKSGKICDKYKNDNIFVYHQINKGQLFARKNGVMKAKGDYTLVVDADDKLDKNCLQKINDILNIYPYDAVMFPYIQCNERLMPSNRLSNIPKKIGKLNQNQVIEWIIKTYMHGLVDKAIRTDIIQKGMTEIPDRKLKINGDYALIIPICCNIKCAYFLNEPLYFYRIYRNSISHNYCFQHLIDTDYVSNYVIKILLKHNLINKKIELLVYEAYLHMISWIARALIEKNELKKQDIKQLNQLVFYKKSKKYEKRDRFNYIDFIELKILRYNLFCFLRPFNQLCIFEKNRIKLCVAYHQMFFKKKRQNQNLRKST